MLKMLFSWGIEMKNLAKMGIKHDKSIFDIILTNKNNAHIHKTNRVTRKS